MDLKIYELLSNKSYYSLSVRYLAHKLSISESYLRSLDHTISTKFSNLFDDPINIFTYNNIVYIGLESRRLAYERDKLNGTNWVEQAILEGKYN
jgi:hypothetical protein